MIYLYKTRHSESDHNKYAPNYLRVENIIFGALIVVIVLFLLAAEFIYASIITPILFTIALILYGLGNFILYCKDAEIDSQKALENANLQSAVMKMEDRLTMTTQQIDELRTRGHTVLAGAGAVVVINSQIMNSFNKKVEEDPALRNIIEIISGLIEKSENKDAGAIWARFIAEIGGHRDKIVMRSLWESAVTALPDIAKIAEGVSKITDLFK